jgi:hypothetical protein
MITQLDIRSAQGDLLSLPLDDVTDGIIVENIEGLDPVKATIVSSSFANGPGSQYQSSHRENRNIKIRLGLEPDYVVDSVSDLRNRLYDYLMPQSEVTLNFIRDDAPEVSITGRVETFESDLFVQEPAVDISIVCFDPDFVDPDEVTLTGSTSSSSTMSDGQLTVNYPGTSQTGVEIVISVNRTESDFTVYHETPDGSIRTLEFVGSLLSGDVLTLSTVYGDKRADLTRSSVTTSVLYGVSPQSTYIQLTRGTNKLRIYTTGAAIPYTINYFNRYGGL